MQEISCTVESRQGLDSFDFHYCCICYQQIDSVSALFLASSWRKILFDTLPTVSDGSQT